MSLLAVAGESMILVASMPGVDPPGWLRIVTIWMLPVGVAASLVTGAVALVIRSGRRAALTGLAISALCVAAFVFIIATAEY